MEKSKSRANRAPGYRKEDYSGSQVVNQAPQHFQQKLELLSAAPILLYHFVSFAEV